MKPWEIRAYIAVIAIAFCMVNYWAFFDRSQATVISEWNVIPEPMLTGKPFTVEFKGTRYRQCDRTEVSAVLFDGGGYRHVMSDISFSGPPGPTGPVAWKYNPRTPDWVVEGMGHLDYTFAWYCNPLQSMFNKPIIMKLSKDVMIAKS